MAPEVNNGAYQIPNYICDKCMVLKDTRNRNGLGLSAENDRYFTGDTQLTPLGDTGATRTPNNPSGQSF